MTMDDRNSILEMILKQLSQTSAFAEAEKREVDPVTDPVYDLLIDPLFEEDKEEGDKAADTMAIALCAQEKFAFKQGFKCALQLVGECFYSVIIQGNPPSHSIQ